MSRTSTSVEPPAQLSRDETRILEQCQRDSLIYRSIPLSICSFFAAQYAMSKNIISIKAKWFKLGAATFVGYMLGKIAYTPTCRQKILTQIPDSNLAQLIRGVETKQIPEVDVHTAPQRSARDINEPIVLTSDAHPISAGVNQYGDPIYKTNN